MASNLQNFKELSGKNIYRLNLVQLMKCKCRNVGYAWTSLTIFGPLDIQCPSRIATNLAVLAFSTGTVLCPFVFYTEQMLHLGHERWIWKQLKRYTEAGDGRLHHCSQGRKLSGSEVCRVRHGLSFPDCRMTCSSTCASLCRNFMQSA